MNVKGYDGGSSFYILKLRSSDPGLYFHSEESNDHLRKPFLFLSLFIFEVEKMQDFVHATFQPIHGLHYLSEIVYVHLENRKTAF